MLHFSTEKTIKLSSGRPYLTIHETVAINN